LRALLDTHAAVFLWEGRGEVFGPRSRALLERAELLLSPLVRLELSFLREVGKITLEPESLVGGLVADYGVALSREPLDALVPRAVPLTWTRDPFDRLLVAHAQLRGWRLATADEAMLAHLPEAGRFEL